MLPVGDADVEEMQGMTRIAFYVALECSSSTNPPIVAAMKDRQVHSAPILGYICPSPGSFTERMQLCTPCLG